MKIITAFKAKDGKLFYDRKECAKYEGLHKCVYCNEEGMETYTRIIPYPEGLPDSGWVDDERVQDLRVCTHCHGTAYVKRNKDQQDPEWDEYVRLKEKFDK